jgi:LmbE family N-acetylglucosaminyl deacetylase
MEPPRLGPGWPATTKPDGRTRPSAAGPLDADLENVVVVSPHFDDAILSCGGLIGLLARRHVRVTVLTVFSGHPVLPLSDAATTFHDKCGLGPTAVAVREAEDDAACAGLAARTARLGLPDCLYRRDPDGTPRYPRIPDIFRMRPDSEKDVIDRARHGLETSQEWNSADLVIGPLGVGDHADHQITRIAVETATGLAHRLVWYEDQPYVMRERCAGWENDMTPGLAPSLIALDPAAWGAKIDAISHYRSQLRALWSDDSSWSEQMGDYAAAVGRRGPAERYWTPLGTRAGG